MRGKLFLSLVATTAVVAGCCGEPPGPPDIAYGYPAGGPSYGASDSFAGPDAGYDGNEDYGYRDDVAAAGGGRGGVNLYPLSNPPPPPPPEAAPAPVEMSAAAIGYQASAPEPALSYSAPPEPAPARLPSPYDAVFAAANQRSSQVRVQTVTVPVPGYDPVTNTFDPKVVGYSMPAMGATVGGYGTTFETLSYVAPISTTTATTTYADPGVGATSTFAATSEPYANVTTTTYAAPVATTTVYAPPPTLSATTTTYNVGTPGFDANYLTSGALPMPDPPSVTLQPGQQYVPEPARLSIVRVPSPAPSAAVYAPPATTTVTTYAPAPGFTETTTYTTTTATGMNAFPSTTATIAAGPAAPARTVKTGATASADFRLVPAPDVPGERRPGDAAPSQWFEIIRPGNGPIRIGRISSTCVCVSPRVPNRHIAAGERALVEARIVSRPARNNLTYGLYVNLVEPVAATVDADVTITL